MMTSMTSKYAATLALLSLVAAPALARAAQPMSPPIRVDACAASAAKPAITFVNVFGTQQAQPAVPAMLMIDFSNASTNPVQSVEFGLVSNGRLVTTVRDAGSFAPNARVMHAYGINESEVPPDAMSTSCVPLRIEYANGTSWMNPSMPAH